MIRVRRMGGWLVLYGALSAARQAHAEPTPQDAATAQALFDDGKRLMQAGQYAEACPKFAESQRLDPGGGTILALALCHESEGKTATAWGEFNMALTIARRDSRPERESAASEHIRALEGRMTRIRITVASKVDGLEVRRNGEVVGEAQWGTPLPVDPGDYRFEARAPKKKTWQATVAAREEGKVLNVVVPALEEDRAVAVAPPPPLDRTPEPPARPPPEETEKSYTWAYVTGGAGVVALGIGAAFGLSASSKWNDAKRACPNNTCATTTGIGIADDARASADASTLFFVVAGAALAASTVLFLFPPTHPKSSAAALHVAPIVTRDVAGIALGGGL